MKHEIPTVICPWVADCKRSAECDHAVPHHPIKNRCGTCNNWLDYEVCKRKGTRPCNCIPVKADA